ncbi:hypothetical protein Efla_004983 [Eimeria flavescens]
MVRTQRMVNRNTNSYYICSSRTAWRGNSNKLAQAGQGVQESCESGVSSRREGSGTTVHWQEEEAVVVTASASPPSEQKPEAEAEAGEEDSAERLQRSNKNNNPSSCESTFTEMCALSERLEAVKAAESRASICTTVSWKSGVDAAAYEEFAGEESDGYSDYICETFKDADECWLFEKAQRRRSLEQQAAEEPPVRISKPRSFSPAPVRQQPPERAPLYWSMQDVVDYLFEQLPLPEDDLPPNCPCPPLTCCATFAEAHPMDGLVLQGEDAVDAIDRVLRSRLLRFNSTKREVVGLARYQLLRIREEKEATDDAQEEDSCKPLKRSFSFT